MSAGLLALVGCSGTSGKDAAVLGTLTGTVTSSAGAALAGVTVTPKSGASAVTTDSSGAYSLSLPAGGNTISFAGDNLEPASADVTIESAKTTKLDQIMSASALVVTVSLPAALKSGGPAGFNSSVSGITAAVKLNGADIAADGVTWSIKDYYGLSDPPAPATPSPATGGTTGFTIPDFETVRTGANAWANANYQTTGTEDAFDYIQVVDRDGLVSLGTQQVRAMSYKVIAKVTKDGRTSTGSAVVAPATITSGGNTLPLGMMVVANAKSAPTYAWTLKFLPMTATTETYEDPPAGVALSGADTKNPTLVPTVAGVYKLSSGASDLYFRVSTYYGVGDTASAAGPTPTDYKCSDCHAGQFALDGKFSEWSNSAHGNSNWKDPFATPMSLFKLGLDGGAEGAHYSESCISCHTVGYSKVSTAQNGGFDDVMKETGWTFPTPPDTLDTTLANWNALPDALKRRGAIQCENCHGPLNPADHGAQPQHVPALFARGLAPGVSMDAGICLVCHDALTHHDRGPLWTASPHAQMDLVLADATVEGRATTAAHCGRCHAAEGFMAYLPQQQGGNPGLIVRPSNLAAAATCTPGAGFTGATDPFDPACPCKPTAPATTCTGDPAFYAYLSGLGLNVATAHSQTCQTCHDPHTTELRIEGDTGVVAAGFNVKGAGAGAICMVCHNSRITAPVYSDSDKTSYSAPHAASQGDVFAGRNAYFFGPATGAAADALPNKTAHLGRLADACAECHVKIVPDDIKAQYKVWNTNHTFRTSLQVCGKCHGANMGQLVTEGIMDKMNSLSTALSLLYKAKINAGGADSMAQFTVVDGAISDTAATTSPAAVAAGEVQRITLAEYHGQPALIVTLTDGTTFGNNIGSFKKATVALFPVGTAAEKISAKSFFNWLLLRGSAEGVHNPAFVNGVLDATLAQVKTVTAL